MTAVLVLVGSVGCTTSARRSEAATDGPTGHGTVEHATVTVIILAPAVACRNTLHQLYGAKHQWALENRKTQTETPTDADLFGATRYMAAKPTCPSGGSYTLGAVRENPTCSIEGHTY